MLHNYKGQLADMLLKSERLMGYIAKPEDIPLSFNYGGIEYKGLPADARTKVIDNGDTVRTIYEGDFEDGILIIAICDEYKNYPVVEWVVKLKNRGAKDSKIFDSILPANIIFEDLNHPILKMNTGDYHSREGFTDNIYKLEGKMNLKLFPRDGRSCDSAWPYQKLMFDEFHLNIAIGWSGTWFTEYERDHNDGWSNLLSFKSGQKRCHTYIAKGETYLTPRITMMIYNGDEDHGVNVWRRWYYDHILIKENGEPLKGKIVYSEGGGGIEFTKADEQNQLEALKYIAEHKIDCDLWWIDAGWYDHSVDTSTYFEERPPMHGDWGNTGTWYPDKERFPNGLKPVGDKCKELGIDFLMWYEPLRVRRGTKLQMERPEWMIDTNHPIGLRNQLLDITNPDCLKWLCEHVSEQIKVFGLKWYREDFNFGPEKFWVDTETDNRMGMIENLHIQAFYQYWDYLKEQNPDLLIDSCASGGRRNDLETMRRGVPLHHTDFGYGYKPICQAFSYSMNRWIPYYKSSLIVWDDGDESWTGETKDCELGSFAHFNNIGPMMAIASPSYLMANPDKKDYIKDVVVPAWSKASPIMLSGDFYSMTEPHRDSKKWTIHQFYSPEKREGLFKVMRNQNCDINTMHVWPKAFDASKNYTFENAESKVKFEKTGREINAEGLTFAQPRWSAEIWFYQET